MLSKTFCSLPWVNISVDPDGSVKPCCISTDYIIKPDGSKFNLGHDDVDSIINSSAYNSIRRAMLSGDHVAGCNQCYKQEQLNGKSQRVLHNEKWTSVALKKINTSAINTIEYFDLRFGNLCNLSCRSCFPGYSSQVAKEVESNPLFQKYHPKLAVDINTWYSTAMFNDNLERHKNNIQQLYITGGEPTIINQNYAFLNDLIESGRSKSITLLVNTNMTNLQEKWLDALSEFKDVLLFVSIDGTGPLQEYVRHPSDWKQIDSNFKKLVSRKSESIQIMPTPVIQSYNLNLITELFEYFESFNREANQTVVSIMPIVLENPHYLNLAHLPREFKQECKSRIEQWMHICRYQTNTFLKRIESVYSACDVEGDSASLKRFIEFTNDYDLSRNQSLALVNPELKGVLDDTY